MNRSEGNKVTALSDHPIIRSSDYHTDYLVPFLLNESPIRGRMVRLGASVDAILKRHDYPPLVSRLLAEVLVLAAMLASNLKQNGILTIQLQSQSAISLLVVDAVYGGALRGYAQFDAAALPSHLSSLDALFAEGYLAITYDSGEEGGRYQGVVPLEGASITQAVQGYFRQSQQLLAQFQVAVGQVDGQWRAGGIYIEQMPEAAKASDESEEWREAAILLATVKEDELLDVALAHNDLLHRLYHERGVWVYEPQPLRDQCRCSQEKLHGIIAGMPAAERADMVEDGQISATCQFCSQTYHFSPESFDS